jgi:pilus assembly protein CpaE
MPTILAAQDVSAANELHAQLMRGGVHCPQLMVQSLAELKDHLRGVEPPPDVILIYLPASSAVSRHAIQDVRGATPAPIVAIGHGNDISDILAVVRAGANDYVVLDDRLVSELNATLERLRLNRTSNNGKVWGIVGASGGSGASTLAANIAVVLAKSAPTCVCDLHWRGGDCAALFDVHPAHTISDLCSQRSRLDTTMFEQALAKHSSGVQLLAAPHETHSTSDLVANCTGLVQFAQTLFRYVVLDLDVTAANFDSTLLACDRLLLVLRPDFPSMLRAKRFIKWLEEHSYPLQKVVPVANRVGIDGELPLPKVSEMLGIAISHAIPDDAPNVLPSVNLGSPVILEYPRSKVAKALHKFASDLMAKETSA